MKGTSENLRWSCQSSVGDTRKKPTLMQQATTQLDSLTGHHVETTASKMGMQVRSERWAYKIVHSKAFEIATYLIIVCSSLFFGASMQHQVECAITGNTMGSWWARVELAFDILFTVEFVLKFMAEDFVMFTGTRWHWNTFDVVLLLAAYTQMLTATFGDLSISRVVRFARLLRILRVIRVVRRFHKLRVMIFTIVAYVDSLAWTCGVVLLFSYVFSMVFMAATIEQFERGGDPEDLELLKAYFGDTFKSLVTLVQSFSGGIDWGTVYDLLYRVDPFNGIIFLFYVYFNITVVMNVVTGTVLESTTRIAQRDRDKMVADELARMKEHMRDVEDFKSADEDDSGRLTWEEFEEVLSTDNMKAQFQKKLELDVRQASKLFTLLDTDGDGEVDIQDFLDGCMRLKGMASAFDMNLTLYQLEQLGEGLQECVEMMRSLHPDESSGNDDDAAHHHSAHSNHKET